MEFGHRLTGEGPRRLKASDQTTIERFSGAGITQRSQDRAAIGKLGAGRERLKRRRTPRTGNPKYSDRRSSDARGRREDRIPLIRKQTRIALSIQQ